MQDAPNIYAAPAAELAGQAPQHAELAAFVGKKAPYFLPKWEGALEGRSASGFNLGALFLGVLYLLYRKLYVQGAILVGVLIAWSVLEEFVPISPGLNAGLQLAFYAVVAFKANDWYLQLALGKIANAKAEGYEGEELLQILRKRGGVNAWAPLLLVAGFVLLVALAEFLPA